MKTNVIMKSPDRDLFGVIVKQESKTQFLSLTDMQRAYNKMQLEKGWSLKEVKDVIRTKDVLERMYFILLEQGFIEEHIHTFIKNCEDIGTVAYLKQIGIWQTKGKVDTREVWCNPYIWVLIAMEMNPEIYAKVVMWLTDALIFNRIEAGTNYRPLTEELSNLKDFTLNSYEYSNIAIAINKRIFGYHENGMRNIATKEDLKKMNKLEVLLTNLIQNSFIKNKKELYHFIDNGKF